DAQADLPKRLMDEKPDVALLALHGKYAEDGIVQGICEYLRIPYSGSGVLGSSLCMDKILTKKILRFHSIPSAAFEIVDARCTDLKTYQTQIPLPFVVKPSREGSSVGVTICKELSQLPSALVLAAKSDYDILIESFLEGPEITVPVLKDRALTPIEIRPYEGFYDYSNKYTAGKTEYLLPPSLPVEMIQKLKDLALKTHQILRARTYSRVDFRMHQAQPFVLEVNTLPGCTPTSLFPKSAMHDGIEFTKLIETLVEEATLDYAGVK
ncbi:MAG: D-alanine--D-alanine ligase, partial [Bdellovibrionales bacterium]|nr:D-alanine--D-alanine ligase [Bdellovibrionales bacterium]